MGKRLAQLFLAKHNFVISENDVLKVLERPDHEDKSSDFPNIIASKTFDATHVLRVVYRVEGDIIRVITFYPAEKGRYY